MMRQGVRPSEARALHFEDIDWKNKTITICRNFSGKEYKEWTKTKKIRVLPLDDEVYNILLDFKAISGFIFTIDGRTYKDSSTLTKIWNRAVKEAGLENIKLYVGTRHSFASQAVNRGVPLNLIQSFLGHTHQSTTKRYTHFDTQGLKVVLKQKAKILDMRKKKTRPKD